MIIESLVRTLALLINTFKELLTGLKCVLGRFHFYFLCFVFSSIKIPVYMHAQQKEYYNSTVQINVVLFCSSFPVRGEGKNIIYIFITECR